MTYQLRPSGSAIWTKCHGQPRIAANSTDSGNNPFDDMPSIEEVRRKPVAYRYRWKIDGEWVKWRFSDASQAHPNLKDFQEEPLYS